MDEKEIHALALIYANAMFTERVKDDKRDKDRDLYELNKAYRFAFDNLTDPDNIPG